MIKRFNEFITENKKSLRSINEGAEVTFDVGELVYEIDGKIYVINLEFTGEMLHQPAEPESGISYGYYYMDGAEPTRITWAETFKDQQRVEDFKELQRSGLNPDFFKFINDGDFRELTEPELAELSANFISEWPPVSRKLGQISKLKNVINNDSVISQTIKSFEEDYENGWDEPDYD